MALAFDSSVSSSTSGASGLTFSHTCSGSNRILFVGVNLSTVSSAITGVTYSGVSMTQVTSQDNTIGTALYYLINPATGANNVIISLSGSNSIVAASASYTGANQFIQPDAFAKAASGSVSLSVVNSLCWVIGVSGANASGSGAIYNAGTGFTLRQSVTSSNNNYQLGLEDSNGTVSTGAKTVSFTTSAGSPGTIIAASIIPSDLSNYFWVGGTGTWDTSTATHWSNTSGGTGGYGVPNSTSGATFDGNSGAGTVTVGASVSALNLSFTNYTGTFTGTNALAVYGNLTLYVGMTFSYTGTITFAATSSKTITNAGKSLATTVFDGVGGIWVMQDIFTSTSSVTLNNGAINFNNQNSSMSSFSSSNTNIRALTLGSGTLTLTGSGTVWNTSGSYNMTLTPNTSTIKLTNATSSSKTFTGGSLIYNNFYITGSGTGTYIIVGSNTFNDFKVDTPPHTINFTAGSTTTVQTFTVNGTVGNLITLQSTVTGTPWYITKPVGTTVVCDYLSLQDSWAQSH